MVDICVCVCVCVCGRYHPYIWARWVVEIMKIWQLINFDCIYCQNFSMKTKFFLGFLFIMITLVSLHNIYVLNYTRNIYKKKKKFSGRCVLFYITALFVSALTFSGKWFIFQIAFSRKLSYFLVFGNDLENELENVF